MDSQQKIWDQLYQQQLHWNRETLDLPLLLENKIVLELGVGSGKTLKSILRQKPKQITAIDFSDQSLQHCKKEFSHYPNLVFVKSQVSKLPFKPKTFDVIVCYYILNNLLLKERNKAVEEMIHVINQNGLIIFEDLAAGDFREKQGQASSAKQPEIHTIIKPSGLVHHFFSPEEVEELFSKFKGQTIKQKTLTPIKNQKQFKRKIISAIFTFQKSNNK